MDLNGPHHIRNSLPSPPRDLYNHQGVDVLTRPASLSFKPLRSSPLAGQSGPISSRELSTAGTSGSRGSSVMLGPPLPPRTRRPTRVATPDWNGCPMHGEGTRSGLQYPMPLPGTKSLSPPAVHVSRKRRRAPTPSPTNSRREPGRATQRSTTRKTPSESYTHWLTVEPELPPLPRYVGRRNTTQNATQNRHGEAPVFTRATLSTQRIVMPVPKREHHSSRRSTPSSLSTRAEPVSYAPNILRRQSAQEPVVREVTLLVPPYAARNARFSVEPVDLVVGSRAADLPGEGRLGDAGVPILGDGRALLPTHHPLTTVDVSLLVGIRGVGSSPKGRKLRKKATRPHPASARGVGGEESSEEARDPTYTPTSVLAACDARAHEQRNRDRPAKNLWRRLIRIALPQHRCVT